MSSTSGYLIVGVWARYVKSLKQIAQQKEEKELMQLLIDNMNGEVGLMDAIMTAAKQVDEHLDKIIDWSDFDGVFDYEHIDTFAGDEETLDKVVWDAIVAGADVVPLADKWLRSRERLAPFFKA